MLRSVFLIGDMEYFILLVSNDYVSIFNGWKNFLIEEKVELGKMLFFEIGLVRDVVYLNGVGMYFCVICYVFSVGYMFGCE